MAGLSLFLFGIDINRSDLWQKHTLLPMPDTCTRSFTIDEQTFEEVYNQHWEKLYSTALYQLQDQDLAKELVQNIFLSLWERRDSLIITSEVANYLSRALKLKILEHYRTEQLRRRHLGEIAMRSNGQENTTENHILLNELRGRVQHFMESLPNQCRRVFELSRLQGLNTREIAVEMVISEKTVKNHLTRALSSFKALL